MSRSASFLAGATPGLSRLAQAVAGGGSAYQQAFDSQMLDRSKMAQALAAAEASQASADKTSVEASLKRRELELQGPEAIRSRALLANGVPLDSSGEVDNYLTSGRIDRFDATVGPAMPAPQWAAPQNLTRIGQSIAQELSTIGGGSKGAKDYYDGRNQQFETALAQAVVAGLPPDQMARGMALLKASPMFKPAEGYTGNVYTGGIDMQAPENVARSGYVAAQTGAQKANATQSYAAAENSRANADLHRAQAQKTRRDLMAAGGDGAPPVSREEAAARLGIPLADVDPYAGLSSKSADIARRQGAGALDKQFAERSEQVQAEQAMARDAERFKALNESTSTGGVSALPGAGAVRGAFDANFAELRAISNRIVPKMREPGSGATSDFDARMFQSATIGPDKPLEANKAIADAMIARAQLAADKLDFDRAYADLNGHLRGADRAWKAYVNANPIFDEEAAKSGRLQINANRVPYQAFFRQQQGATVAPRPAGPATPVRPGQRPPLESFRRP